MKYLGIEPKKPRIAVFDFTGCEGCELQLANKEETLGAFLSAVEIVNFREVTSAKSDDYDIAFIDGAISREDEVARLKDIRGKAKVLVAMGSCASFGGGDVKAPSKKDRRHLGVPYRVSWCAMHGGIPTRPSPASRFRAVAGDGFTETN